VGRPRRQPTPERQPAAASGARARQASKTDADQAIASRIDGACPIGVGQTPCGGDKDPAVYSRRLAELGYAALAFDHSTYGESDGTPRSDEHPFAKSEDIKSAVTFLTSRAEVGPERIGALGVCGGGGFVP
jgi:hypothetical protein